MSHVSGPTSYLPGSYHPVPSGTMCDDHPDVPAVVRIQGETDSFGAEYHDCCQVCVDEHEAACKEEANEEAYCDWCKKLKTNLRPRRDPTEGEAGPVYYVCHDCIVQHNAVLKANGERSPSMLHITA